MNWSAISLIAGTDAYFNDTEISENNILTAGSLDFYLTGKGFHAYGFYQTTNWTQKESVEVINNADNLDFRYSVSAGDISGGAFCDSLVLSVDLNSVNIYSGSLSGLESDLNASNIPAPSANLYKDKWDFEITSGSSDSGTCYFDFVFQARQENLIYGEGFFDEEKIGNVVSTETDCGPADYVVINEVQVDGIIGTGGSSDNYIELYNPTGKDINLEDDNYRIERWTEGGTRSIVVRFNEIDSSTGEYVDYIKITDPAVVPAYGFYLVVDEDATDTDLKNKADALVTRTFNLDDNYAIGLGMGPMNGPEDNDTIDFVGWGSNSLFEGTAAAPNPPESQSIERGLNGYDDNNNSKDFIIKENPTPTNSNGDGMPEIVINEFLATGDGISYSDFVEIYNRSNGDVDLNGWSVKIENNSNGTETTTITEAIAANGWLVVYYNDLAILTDGGSITIYDNNGNEADKISYYDAVTPNSSFARIPDGSPNWIDPIPTPKTTNEIYENLIIAGLDDLIGDNSDSTPPDPNSSINPPVINPAPEPVIPEPIPEPTTDDTDDEDTDTEDDTTDDDTADDSNDTDDTVTTDDDETDTTDDTDDGDTVATDDDDTADDETDTTDDTDDGDSNDTDDADDTDTTDDDDTADDDIAATTDDTDDGGDTTSDADEDDEEDKDSETDTGDEEETKPEVEEDTSDEV